MIYCCASIVKSEQEIFTYHMVDWIQIMDGFTKSAKYVIGINDVECEARAIHVNCLLLMKFGVGDMQSMCLHSMTMMNCL